jgi:hypothetical protein
VNLTLTGTGGATYVVEGSSGAVCIVGGDAAAACLVAGDGGPVHLVPGPGGAVYVEQGDGGVVHAAEGDGGVYLVPDDGGDGDGGDSGVKYLVANYVASGYLLAPQTVNNLAPGGGVSAPASVTFVPTAATPYPATVAIQTSDALCSALPAPIQVTGSGTQGQVSLSATTLAFGTDPKDARGLVNCGATGLPQTLTVLNTGNQPFHVTGLMLGMGAKSPYALSGPGTTLPVTVAIGAAVPITVTRFPRASPIRTTRLPSPTR